MRVEKDGYKSKKKKKMNKKRILYKKMIKRGRNVHKGKLLKPQFILPRVYIIRSVPDDS